MWHPDQDVNTALIRLNDALCQWERNTGRQSVLILREQGGYVHRSMSGKPNTSDMVIDSELLETVRER